VAIELLGMNWGYALMACDQAKEYMKAVGLGAILSVILNLGLIPKFGLLGAGLTRLACSAIISLYFGFQFRRISHLEWARHLLKPALASALMVAVMVFVGHSWILQMILGGLVYACTILAIGPSERAEVLRIANAILAPSATSLPVANSVLPVTKGTRPTEIVET